MPPRPPELETIERRLVRHLLERIGLRPDAHTSATLEAHAREVAPDRPPVRLYERYLREPTGSRVLTDLAERLAVPESSFFRHPAHFETLERVVIPMARRNPAREGLRILSAGCARGEEVYSLAISCQRAWPGGAHKVFGVDRSADALQAAILGRYRSWAMRGVDPDTLEPWLARVGAEWVVHPNVRARARFVRGDVLALPEEIQRAAPFNLIFCRNVLLYFTEKAARDAVAGLAALLAPEGLLFVGPAEHDFCTALEAQSLNGVYAYRARPRAPVAPVAPAEPRPRAQPASRKAPAEPPQPPRPAPARTAAPPPAAPRPSYDALLAEGHAALKAGKHEEALRKFDDAMRLCPERPEAYFEQAILLTERGMLPASRELLDRALALDACFLPAMVLLARVHLRTGKADKAHALLLQVVTALTELDDAAPLQGWPSMTAGALRKSCERLLERGAIGEAR